MKALTYVEIDVDYCALQFGTSPCTAAAGSNFPAAGLPGAVFNGESYATRGSNLTGIANSKLFTIAGVIRRQDNGFAEQVIFSGANALAGSSPKGVRVSIDKGDRSLRIRAYSGGGTEILSVKSATGSVPVSDSLVCFVASFDLSDTNKRHLLINGVNALHTVSTYANTTIDLSLNDYSVAGMADDEDRFSGVIAYLWFRNGYYIDLSQPTNVAKFYNTTTGAPEYLGDNGELITGSAPIVYLAGQDWLANLGTGGAFTLRRGSLGSIPIGTRCFNTLATCRDRLNFDNEPVTIRFAMPADYLPASIDAIPALEGVTVTPAILSLGEDLGQRATLSARFRDFPWPDTDAAGDKYTANRAYDPFALGTFWGKFRARQPYLAGRPMRLVRGAVGQSYAEMEKRHFVVDTVDGPKPDGSFIIKGSDPLKFASGSRARAPRLSNGYLASGIDADDTEITLGPTGIGNVEYPTTGYLNIGGKEIVQLTARSGDVCTIVRGAYNTEAVAHDAEERVQLCLRYNDTAATTAIYDLLLNYTDLKASELPTGEWVAEATAYLEFSNYSALIPEPTPVDELVSELIQQVGLIVWWSDVEQEVKLRALRPIGLNAGRITPDNTLRGSLSVSEQPRTRISQVWTYFGQINPLRPLTDRDNWKFVQASVNLQAETDYGSLAIKEIFSRWIPVTAGGVSGREYAQKLNQIWLSRFTHPPRRFSGALIRGDELAIEAGEGYRLEASFIQDETGALTSAPIQVTSLAPEIDRDEFEAEEMFFANIDVLDL